MKYTGKKFDGANVTLDFNEYVDCEFSGCEMIYKGGNLPVFENCNFSQCRFSLVEKAQNTLDYLAFLYQNMAETGGQAFAEEQLAKVKG